MQAFINVGGLWEQTKVHTVPTLHINTTHTQSIHSVAPNDTRKYTTVCGITPACSTLHTDPKNTNTWRDALNCGQNHRACFKVQSLRKIVKLLHQWPDLWFTSSLAGFNTAKQPYGYERGCYGGLWNNFDFPFTFFFIVHRKHIARENSRILAHSNCSHYSSRELNRRS